MGGGDVDGLGTLVLLLGRLERLNETFVADVCRRHRVLPSDVRVLAVLRHNTAGTGLRPTDIASWVVQTPGGLTATLGRLERQGLVERVDDPDDRRSRLVALTGAGAGFYDAVLSDLLERYGLALGGVDVDDALRTVRALVAAFERFAGAAPSAGWALGSQLTRS